MEEEPKTDLEPELCVFVAATKKGGIGMNEGIPWKLPADLKRFKELTTQTAHENNINTCIMGRKTYLSIPAKMRPLKDRMNIVITTTKKDLVDETQIHICPDLETALSIAKYCSPIKCVSDGTFKMLTCEKVFVIGGGKLINETMSLKECKKIYLTEIEDDFECDTFIDPIPAEYVRTFVSEDMTENGVTFRFKEFVRVTSK